jgi:hypothetical protein
MEPVGLIVQIWQQLEVQLAGAGTQTAALGFGGFTTTVVANTEEYTGAFDTVTASTLTTS